MENMRRAKIGEIENMKNQLKDKERRFQKFNFVEI